MALFYLVRHGEAIYDNMLENGFWGFGRDFAPLSEKGKQQAWIPDENNQYETSEESFAFASYVWQINIQIMISSFLSVMG